MMQCNNTFSNALNGVVVGVGSVKKGKKPNYIDHSGLNEEMYTRAYVNFNRVFTPIPLLFNAFTMVDNTIGIYTIFYRIQSFRDFEHIPVWEFIDPKQNLHTEDESWMYITDQHGCLDDLKSIKPDTYIKLYAYHNGFCDGFELVAGGTLSKIENKDIPICRGLTEIKIEYYAK